jgi:hypothetical protein
MPVGTFTKGALMTPYSAFALLLRKCGPRSEVSAASETVDVVWVEDTF